MMEIVIAGGAVGAFVLIIASILLLRRAEEDPLSVRIDEYASREEAATKEEIELSLPITDLILVPIVSRLISIVILFTPQSML
jgi:hypothetical protein